MNSVSLEMPLDALLEGSSTYKIYNESDKEFSNCTYNVTNSYPINYKDEKIKNIFKQMIKNLNEFSSNLETQNYNHMDCCTYLNFLIYSKLYKLYKYTDTNTYRYILDIPEINKISKKDIEINKDLIREKLKQSFNTKILEKKQKIEIAYVMDESHESEKKTQQSKL
ncbi:variable surface protein [Plasmodium gonderi]|uniref:Variable surface protein n=1 Tax=Plasmodium gonderi TaxID=77519 RepID=A0A1Y1JLG0_PLAGO|nr:variable surface protein [Plasmodium gonderi]GAW81243.1 variable surface protein [Plasmodium gonderi]